MSLPRLVEIEDNSIVFLIDPGGKFLRVIKFEVIYQRWRESHFVTRSVMEQLDLEERLEWYFYEFYRLKQEEIRVLRDLQTRIHLEGRDPDDVAGGA